MDRGHAWLVLSNSGKSAGGSGLSKPLERDGCLKQRKHLPLLSSSSSGPAKTPLTDVSVLSPANPTCRR